MRREYSRELIAANPPARPCRPESGLAADRLGSRPGMGLVDHIGPEILLRLHGEMTPGFGHRNHRHPLLRIGQGRRDLETFRGMPPIVVSQTHKAAVLITRRPQGLSSVPHNRSQGIRLSGSMRVEGL